MIMKRCCIGITLIGMLAVSLLNSGCSKKKARSAAQVPDFAITCIAVAPATSATPLDSELLSEIERKELDDGLYYMNKLLKKHFLSRKDVRLFSDGQFGDIESSSERQSLERAKAYADKLSCNAVLETTLHRYKERVGGEMTAKDPASVAFEYRLLGMPDGQMLCQDSFDAEQQSLMENLLSFREGTGGSLTWLSAKDFMNKGLLKRLEKCPFLVEEE
ncbi:MAG: hypothetical protein Q3M24_05710 [Candidatus Electrothrix aestuarii]|uniref:Lipoprotein n=1 Tax=Candidatus Electrothrix aestuarii TaxID=3062594 RepID=A0AAU8LY98_9BACT